MKNADSWLFRVKLKSEHVYAKIRVVVGSGWLSACITACIVRIMPMCARVWLWFEHLLSRSFPPVFLAKNRKLSTVNPGGIQSCEIHDADARKISGEEGPGLRNGKTTRLRRGFDETRCHLHLHVLSHPHYRSPVLPVCPFES